MRVLAVIALYKRSPEQSQTLVSLGVAFGRHPEALKSFHVLVWDNSPTALSSPATGFPSDYFHSSKNVGTSGAFNGAMELAEKMGIPWLLLLDHDTTIPEEFVPKIAAYAQQFAHDREVAAVVPLLWCRGQMISPNRLGSYYRVLPVPRTCHNTCFKKQVFACDSASLMRVSALREAGGYDEGLFWLDFSDIYIFAAFYRNGRSVYIASDLQLEHSLSITDYGNQLTPERYSNFLAAEGAFLVLYGSRRDNVALTVRLLARSAKQYLRHQDKAFAKMSWKAFLDRVLLAKATRLERWQKELTGPAKAFGNLQSTDATG